MQEHELKQAAEITALTQMVDLLLAVVAEQRGWTDVDLGQIRDSMVEGWEQTGIPGVEASASDHLSAEVVEAIGAFWQRLLERRRRSRGPS